MKSRSAFKRLLPRAWYYFRMGYTIYIAFAIGFFGSTSAIYYLAIKSVPVLQEVFPSYTLFLVIVALTFVPASIFAGWVHMKRSPMYRSEQDIAVESNPYNYKATVGKDKDLTLPTNVFSLLMSKRFAEKYGLLKREEELQVYDELVRRYKWLSDGKDIRDYVPKYDVKSTIERMIKELEEPVP